MRQTNALRQLAELSASQWGMVTTSQAVAHGVQRLDLSRLARAGHLERLTHGVYRDAGAPSVEFEGLRAAWLATEPALTAEQRLRSLAGGVVVMGESAASLHGVGDLPAGRREFSAPVRRQSQRPDIRYRQRKLERRDVTIVHGLPVTTIERTVADLVEVRTDLSLVAHVVRDAARTRRLDTHRLVELLGPLAARNGLTKGDGAALLDRLTALAGLDAGSVADEIAASETLSALVAANRLARFSHTDLSEAAIGPAMEKALRGLRESIARSVEQSMAPALESLSVAIADSPAVARLRATLAEAAEQVALSFPTQDLLRSIGREWAATLTTPVAGAGTDLVPVIAAIEMANGVGVVRTRG